MPRPDLPKIAILVVACFVMVRPACAELGGPLASVEADRVHMAARIVSADMGTYTRHALTRVNGGAVHELTNANGQVFAVLWSGPGKPDLRTLLGSHFATFQSASGTTGRGLHGLRRPAQVSEANLQVQTEGHMGWFRGVAFIPSLAPPGFSLGDLREP